MIVSSSLPPSPATVAEERVRIAENAILGVTVIHVTDQNGVGQLLIMTSGVEVDSQLIADLNAWVDRRGPGTPPALRIV